MRPPSLPFPFPSKLLYSKTVHPDAHGGGFEIALNADLVLASRTATFALPDVQRGTAALMGGLPRLCRTVGLQRAMLLALTGRVLAAEEAREWGLVLKVVDAEELVSEAVRLASEVVSGSPDSVFITRVAVRRAWEVGVREAGEGVWSEFGGRLIEGENVREGLRAFRERRVPRWVASKL